MDQKSLGSKLSQVEIRINGVVYGEGFGSRSDPPSLALIGSAFTIDLYSGSPRYMGPISLEVTPDKVTGDPIDGLVPFGIFQVMQDDQMYATVHVEGANLEVIYTRTVEALTRKESKIHAYLQVSPSFEMQKYGDYPVVSLSWSWWFERQQSEP